MKKYIYFFLITLLFAACSTDKKVEVVVSNPLGMDRNNEIIEISKAQVVNKLGLKSDRKFIISDGKNQIPYQIASNPLAENDSLLIFPVSVKANGNSTYTVKIGTPEEFEPKVYGRLVPERKDDFTWENDKVAYRVYGPALQATGEISSGIDFWAKKTDKLIIDKWYADDLSGKQSYHADNGEGLDYYKVGPTLGAGASAPYINNQLWMSKNFTDYEILDNGPLRITVRYNFESYPADETEVNVSRIISLDAGSQLNKIYYLYDFKADDLPVASGIVTRGIEGELTTIDANKRYATYKEPEDANSGTTYTAIVGTKPYDKIEVKDGHVLSLQTAEPAKPIIYYSGAGWSKGGIETYENWNKYISDFSEKVVNPLTVELR